ncbi:type IV-A pilus assembly ATPase PilB [Desulfomonile tiedjei]|uniref:protein-secreting ATPase n=1 Tax=Desulfomonile tiedjei (strain ATCC 49306 / DSM 6799 / DCB-1) TaxID=706587 RepID=I4C895_DESTA|nr:type IV-A pilus assembly ATPase PilB [Desulfomonile tiedjei]AFM25786.1 general secretory pathway protein E/type IV-A pilus assembly ATPase PilB [Desulfomonile tiedjei DSM 6799]
MKDRIGEMLLRAGIIDEEKLERATDYQRNQGGKIYSALIKLDLVDEDDVVEFLSRQLGLPTVSLDEIDVDTDAVKLIAAEKAQKYMAIPYSQVNSTLYVAMADPTDLNAIDDIKFMTNMSIEVSIATESQIKKSLDAFYDAGLQTENVLEGFDDEDLEAVGEIAELDANDAAKMAEEAPVVKLVNYILREAINKRASDIHVEPYEKVLRVRLRIDGSLYEIVKPPMKLKNPMVSRIKIMARLDIAERRLPQDGRIKLKLGKGRDMDFRVSVLPTLFGEKVVMRLLDKSNLQLDMTKLGFEEKPLRNFKEAIHKPFGMVLVTGPTGSGKTTTLYSALSELNSPDVNVSTAEDPVEFNLHGINQVQMHEEIGLTFASSLRSFLRQDPDIIMVGEIRDFETAEIAVKAALTGHLVLSTLHTNDAPQTINRLLNMGVEPFLVASSVNAIVAQRLARRICSQCKMEIDPPAEALRDLGVKMEDIGTFPIYQGTGCAMCANTGFKGRVALYEVMPITDELKELILAGASALELKREAIRLGMDTLRMAGVNKLKEGVTTINEVARVTMPD